MNFTLLTTHNMTMQAQHLSTFLKSMLLMYNFLLNMFSRQFLQRLAHSLWDKESEEEPKPIGDGQDAQ